MYIWTSNMINILVRGCFSSAEHCLTAFSSEPTRNSSRPHSQWHNLWVALHQPLMLLVCEWWVGPPFSTIIARHLSPLFKLANGRYCDWNRTVAERDGGLSMVVGNYTRLFHTSFSWNHALWKPWIFQPKSRHLSGSPNFLKGFHRSIFITTPNLLMQMSAGTRKWRCSILFSVFKKDTCLEFIPRFMSNEIDCHLWTPWWTSSYTSFSCTSPLFDSIRV